MVGSQWKIFSDVGTCLEKLLCGQDGLDLRKPEGRGPSDTTRRDTRRPELRRDSRDGEEGIRARETRLCEPMHLKGKRKEEIG